MKKEKGGNDFFPYPYLSFFNMRQRFFYALKISLFLFFFFSSRGISY